MGAVRVPAGTVILSGSELETTLYAVRAAQQFRRQIGLPPLAQLARLVGVMSGAGQADIVSGSDQHSESVKFDLSIAEAAVILGCSERHARRLAPGLGGRRISGHWIVDRLAVMQHAEGAALTPDIQRMRP